MSKNHLANPTSVQMRQDFVSYTCLGRGKVPIRHFHLLIPTDKNYNVRDGSDWEKTLKPRIHDRINNSKNLILFLSSITKNSKALREEIYFGINTSLLPVVVVYPEYLAVPLLGTYCNITL